MRISILSKLYDNLCKDVNKRNQKVVHYITRSNTNKDLSDITNQPIQKLLLVTNEDNLLCCKTESNTDYHRPSSKCSSTKYQLKDKNMKPKFEGQKIYAEEDSFRTIDSSYNHIYANNLIGENCDDYLSSIKTDHRIKDFKHSIKLESHIKMLNQPIVNNKTGRFLNKNEGENYPLTPKNEGKENENTMKSLKNLKCEIIDRVNIKFAKRDL